MGFYAPAQIILVIPEIRESLCANDCARHG